MRPTTPPSRPPEKAAEMIRSARLHAKDAEAFERAADAIIWRAMSVCIECPHDGDCPEACDDLIKVITSGIEALCAECHSDFARYPYGDFCSRRCAERGC